jgi:hypothetical protein
VTLRKSFVCTVVAAALLASPLVATDALAKKKGGKQKLQVLVNGKKFKPKPKLALVAAYEPTVHVFTLSGVYTKASRRGGTVKNLVVSCNVDLGTAAFPVTVSDCTGSFSELSYKGAIPGGSPTGWAGGTINVTFQSFDGTTAKGTFEGSLDPGAGASGPATLSKGVFQVRPAQ